VLHSPFSLNFISIFITAHLFLQFHSFPNNADLCFAGTIRSNVKETTKFHQTWWWVFFLIWSLQFQIQNFPTVHISCPLGNLSSFSQFGCCLMIRIHPWELGSSGFGNKFMRLIILFFYWKSQGTILLIIYAFGGSGNKLLWAVLVNVTVSFSLMASFYVRSRRGDKSIDGGFSCEITEKIIPD